LWLYVARFGFQIETLRSFLYAQRARKSSRAYQVSDAPTLPADEEQELNIEPNPEALEWYTKKERCDQCGVAQAFYRVEFSSGFLFLCRHHFMKHENRIYDEAIDIVDESELL
jgi:ribosomal protein S14